MITPGAVPVSPPAGAGPEEEAALRNFTLDRYMRVALLPEEE